MDSLFQQFSQNMKYQEVCWFKFPFSRHLKSSDGIEDFPDLLFLYVETVEFLYCSLFFVLCGW